MMGVSPEEVVDPPATEPARHGLVQVARNIGRVREGDGRWEGGFVFQPENCIASEVWIPCGDEFGSGEVPPSNKKEYDGEQIPIEVNPYIVEVPYTCSSWGFQVNDYEGKAARQLQAGLSKAIEREFWTGEGNPYNPNLTYWTPNTNDHIVNPGGAAAPVAVNVSIGIALLEQALASCGHGGRGMIHAAPTIISRSAGLYLIDDDDTNEGRILTTRSRGDVIIAGAGYPLTGPNGQPAPGTDEGWMFATGMVDVWLGEPRIYPETFAHALDRATNTVTFRGEQTAAATHDGCCWFAVLVDYSADL